MSSYSLAPSRASGSRLTGLLKSSEYSHSSGSGGVPSPGDIDISSPPKFDFEKGKLRWGGSWLDWEGPGRYTYLIPLGPLSYSYQAIWDSPYPENVRSELIRFLKTLELWETTPGYKIITAHEVWSCSLQQGPDFADILKDLFDVTWREDEMDSYNFVFPARFLPRWNSSTDDLSLTLEDTFADEDVLDEFEYFCDIIISNAYDKSGDIDFPSDEEIIFSRSTTTSYIYDEDRTCPQWEASLANRRFSTDCIRSKRCVVPVYPGGFRDTVIADITANYSIRWLERSMRHILQYVPESAVTLHSATFLKRCEDVVNYEGWHVLRDLKKCGLTYNVRQLFPIIKRVLIKYYKDPRWSRLDIFQDMTFVDDGVEYRAKRGYFLGMANHIVTLANIVVHYMAREAIPSGIRGWKARAIFGNDDCDVAFSKKEPSLAYLECEHDIHGRLGNLTNFKKSVVKPYGLFYEQYNKPGWKYKESLVCNALACAYLAPDIRTAKLYIASQSERFISPWSRKALRSLCEWWGSEFFDVKTEFNINFEIGGWLNTTSNGLKTTLRDLDRLREKYSSNLLSYAAKYCRIFMSAPKPQFKRPGIAYNHMYKGKATKSDPLIQIYTITDEDLREYYKKLTSYQRNYSHRIANFYKRTRKIRPHADLDNLYRYILGTTPWHQIPDSMAEEDPDWYGTVQTTFLHELEGETEDHVGDLIALAEGRKDYSMIWEETLKWDPLILPKWQNMILISDLHQVYYASQFSNSGTIPLLDYYERWETLPICKPLGRLRVPSLVGEREHLSQPLSRFSRKKENKNVDIMEEFTLSHGADSGPSLESLEKALENYGERDPDLIAREAARLKAEREEKETPPISEETFIRLTRMHEAMTNRLDYHVYMRQYEEPQEETPDIFEDVEEDLGLDFESQF